MMVSVTNLVWILFFSAATTITLMDKTEAATPPREEQEETIAAININNINKSNNPLDQMMQDAGNFLKTLGNSSDAFPNLLKGMMKASTDKNTDGNDLLNQMTQSFLEFFREEEEQDDATTDGTLLQSLFRVAKRSQSDNRSAQQVIRLFTDAFRSVLQQLEANFAHVKLKKGIHPVALWYYMERTEEILTPSQKRRLHRFDAKLQPETIQELHRALYLSQLSYAATSEQDVRDGLKTFSQSSSWKLLYAKTEGFPGEPAHFVALQKTKRKKNWLHRVIGKQQQQQQQQQHEVMIVVRGTKELGDVLSDGLLEAVDFMGGKAHAGIARAGRYIVQEHIDVLRDSAHVWLVGHSLGAGTAAIAAMMLRAQYGVQATSVGFGCPSLVSWDLSQRFQPFITTVVSDADVVPRMSGATLANTLLDVASFDWTNKALVDMQATLQHYFGASNKNIIQFFNDTMDKFDRPFFGTVTKERLQPILFPPGTCAHLFRDGSGFTATYTNCSFFGQIEVSRTMIDDHLIPPGYHRAMLEVMRESQNDYNFDFPNDVVSLKA